MMRVVVSEPLMRRLRREYLGFPSPELEIALLTGEIEKGEVAPLVVKRSNFPSRPIVELWLAQPTN